MRILQISRFHLISNDKYLCRCTSAARRHAHGSQNKHRASSSDWLAATSTPPCTISHPQCGTRQTDCWRLAVGIAAPVTQYADSDGSHGRPRPSTAQHGLSPILREPAADTPRPHVRKRRPCDALSAHASHTAPRSPRSTQTRQFICRLCQLPGVTVSQAIDPVWVASFFFYDGEGGKGRKGCDERPEVHPRDRTCPSTCHLAPG